MSAAEQSAASNTLSSLWCRVDRRRWHPCSYKARIRPMSITTVGSESLNKLEMMEMIQRSGTNNEREASSHQTVKVRGLKVFLTGSDWKVQPCASLCSKPPHSIDKNKMKLCFVFQSPRVGQWTLSFTSVYWPANHQIIAQRQGSNLWPFGFRIMSTCHDTSSCLIISSLYAEPDISVHVVLLDDLSSE